VCDEACQKAGLSRKSSRIIVQGFGQRWLNAALLMHQQDIRLLVLASRRRLHNKNGIDVKASGDFRQKNGTVHSFPGAEKPRLPTCSSKTARF